MAEGKKISEQSRRDALTGGEMIPFAEGGKNGYILSSLLKGQQGEKGNPGDAGADGKTPVFKIGTVTTLEPGSEVTASVTPDGTDALGNPKYRINVGIPKGYDGSEGSPGKEGVTPSITAKATVDNTSGTPNVSVSKGGEDVSPVFTFEFTGLKGASGESGIAPVTDHGTDDTTFELTPNVLHRWGEVASLTLTLGAETPGIVNEYMFQFTSGATATQLSLPETVKWTSTPEIAANTVYQVSIVDNLAVMGGWSDE